MEVVPEIDINSDDSMNIDVDINVAIYMNDDINSDTETIESESGSEFDWSSDDDEAWDDPHMNDDNNYVKVCKWWNNAKEIFSKNKMIIKNRTFYAGDSIRTQQRHSWMHTEKDYL